MQPNECTELNPETTEKKMPSYFYFWTKYCNYFDLLTDEQAGRVMKYICCYARGMKLDSPQDAACNMLIQIMKQDIDNSFRKYRAQCENGKKGGAPKGNKNAAKNKSDSIKCDEVNYEIAFKISAVLYFEAEKGGYKVDDYLNIKQLALVTACYYFLDCDKFNDVFTKPKTLIDLINDRTAAGACVDLKNAAKAYYEACEYDIPFDEAFTDTIKRALKLLQIPRAQLECFIEKCERKFDK